MTTIGEIRRLVAELGRDGYRDGSSVKAGIPYQPIAYIGLSDLSVQKASQARSILDLLSKDLRLVLHLHLRLLDIGANVGFHSLFFADCCGFDVTAIENDPANVRVLRALANWRGLQIEISERLDDCLTGRPFDVCLMLNVHHWIYKQRGPAATADLMKRLAGAVRRIYFQTAHAGVRSFVTVPELRDPQEIRRYLGAAGFKHVRRLGIIDDRYLFAADGAKQ